MGWGDAVVLHEQVDVHFVEEGLLERADEPRELPTPEKRVPSPTTLSQTR